MLPGNAIKELTSVTLRLPALLLLLLLATPSSGQVIQQTISDNLTATAELMPGTKAGKNILILHGFLQTRDFFTVRRLANTLHEEGHTVLLPTLSLGIDHRQQSLACEAIHNHSMAQDVTEISLWVDWLSRHSSGKITLIGHSIGSLQLLAYLDGTPSSQIEDAILISLIAFSQGPIAKESEQDRLKALAQQESGELGLFEYPLAFCDRYASTPENYLSYLDWNAARSLATLNRLNIRTTVIYGGSDKRLGDNWLPQLRKANVKTVGISNANHFFNHQHEFDLSDTITELLE
jgi:pimeloyl-ACP methyl ester carboxylesterase